ncbi:hypothetical protein [Bradyrhizobium valentinum]|uniref:hypothetical protein n=1 Tax=Bradyrhizobium valentinum TaxID=1518501 RepID=UPI00070A8632|nr:hypothetical protein [Bradyrhizobium valentinum]KRR14229.1 hypothetical protein CQ10_00470 [Bradyrhizobium valentinum]
MLSAILFQPLPSALIALTAFFVMIWPGYALLHLAGHGRHRWSAALFAGPAATLALWIIALSGAAWASVPLKSIFGPVWIATLLLAALGVALRLSVNRRVAANAADTRQDRLWLWATAALLPLLMMPATLRYGLGDFVNSTYADPWSYIMVADYLSAVARGAEGGLSSLHQYASHLMNTRNASSAILAHLSFGLEGVKADQAMVPFCLLLLFANTSALIGFARSSFGRTEAALGLALLAGLGWPANIVFAGNFDQLLLLPLLPLIAALALRAGGGINLWGASVLIGVLSAAALLAYVELAFIGLVIAMAFVIAPGTRLRLAIGRTLLVCCIAVPVFVLLTWPGLNALMTMLKSQYSTTTAGAVRPGDGYFLGLLALRRLPDTLWALGGEYSQSRWIALPWLLGALLCTVTLLGAWVERRRWGANLALATVAAAFIQFAVREHYSYAAYKIISVNFWMISFFTVAGGICLAGWAKPRLPQRVSIAAVVTTVLLVVVAERTVVQANVIRFKHNALQQKAYREAQTISGLVQHAPTLLAVRDDLANEWAVFYLSDVPLLIAPYRIYMAQAHVIPFMERAKPVDPAAIRYIVTDRNDTIRAPLWGARRIWDGETYSLWEADDSAWTVLADVINPNGIEPGGIWLGGAKTDFLAVAGQAGSAALVASVQPGPRAAPEAQQFHVTIENSAGARTIEIQPGEISIPMELNAGKSSISITINDPVGGKIPTNGDIRPMILRMMDYGIKRSIKPSG